MTKGAAGLGARELIAVTIKVTHGRDWEPMYSFPWQPDPVRPDVVNFGKKAPGNSQAGSKSTGTYSEIKPFTLSGLNEARQQITKYDRTFSPLGLVRETWPRGIRLTSIWERGARVPTLIAFFNIGGVIFYTDALHIAALAVVAPAGASMKPLVARASQSFGARLVFLREVGQKSRAASLRTTQANATMISTIGKF